MGFNQKYKCFERTTFYKFRKTGKSLPGYFKSICDLQEEKTGRLSGIRHIVDMTGFEINPFTMVFATTGNLNYYSQLLHFENYPELVGIFS